jgi:predicted transcriptional regulator
MPKANIDGTQRPIKIAEFTSPLKYNISEKISEIIAAINKSLSVIVNFLNMIL